MGLKLFSVVEKDNMFGTFTVVVGVVVAESEEEAREIYKRERNFEDVELEFKEISLMSKGYTLIL